MTFVRCHSRDGTVCRFADGEVRCTEMRQKTSQLIGYTPEDCPHFDPMRAAEAYRRHDDPPQEAA